jgi:hypothetical protein
MHYHRFIEAIGLLAALTSPAAARAQAQQADTTKPAPRPTGAINPRLLPDLSVVGDLIFDLSPKGSTQESGARFGVREVEVALQAAVDPYFRGDIYFGFSDVEGVSIEQAFLTATSLPWQLEARLGRFIVPFGKQNLTHRHDLHTVDYPYAIQRLLGEEGLKGTGGYLSKVFSPFGFYQEAIVTVLDAFGEPAEGLTAEEPANRHLSGLGYTARLRNYWDLTPNANLEVAASAGTGQLPQPISASGEVNAINVRQSVVGVDVTYRWRPLRQGLYRSLIVQAEYLRQINPEEPDAGGEEYLGPRRSFDGAYLFARYQLSRRGHLGVRGDLVEDPEADGRTLSAASAYYEFFPSEFSKLLAGYERVWRQGQAGENRLVVQATFALGPHRPHPF